jgi:16S rRNA (cytidine1402-2'-O)-methyltransferase
VKGRLVLCGTPIGNLEDLSPRAAAVLGEADVIACEDTRRTRKLLSHIGTRPKELVVVNEATEARMAKQIVERVRKGETVVLVSDAGMPGLSDPGYRLVSACTEAGLTVEVVPGPSAVIAALAVSGLPPGRFAFEGFLPKKSGDRRRRLREVAADPRTLIFFVSPHRLAEHLADVEAELGDRPAALARELTKMHEEVWRGSLSELKERAEEGAGVKGEMVLVVFGAVHEHKPKPSSEVLAAKAEDKMDAGTDRKTALTEVARETGVPRREVFDALVAHRDKESDEPG